jgi:hypothetical protein
MIKTRNLFYLFYVPLFWAASSEAVFSKILPKAQFIAQRPVAVRFLSKLIREAEIHQKLIDRLLLVQKAKEKLIKEAKNDHSQEDLYKLLDEESIISRKLHDDFNH